MTTLAFFTYLRLILDLPGQCVVAGRAPGYWFPDSPGYMVHTAIVYGGSCIQAWAIQVMHPALDWWQA